LHSLTAFTVALDLSPRPPSCQALLIERVTINDRLSSFWFCPMISILADRDWKRVPSGTSEF
jgi:hypothetical protein